MAGWGEDGRQGDGREREHRGRLTRVDRVLGTHQASDFLSQAPESSMQLAG